MKLYRGNDGKEFDFVEKDELIATEKNLLNKIEEVNKKIELTNEQVNKNKDDIKCLTITIAVYFISLLILALCFYLFY